MPQVTGYYQNITKKLERDYAGRITFAGTGNTWAEIDQQLRALIDQELAP
jgi:hypothetical protein